MTRLAIALLGLLVWRPFPAAGQDSTGLGEKAESLQQSGRPWHAAELLSRTRGPTLDAGATVRGAEAELAARRYERARTLLAGQPWLGDYGNGEALAALAEAEARLGMAALAALHFEAAGARARGARAALLAVHEALAWEQLGERDSAAQAYAAAREGLPVIDDWLRLREARVVRDTTRAFALLADLPAPVSRNAPAARARARLASGDTAGAIEAFARAGKALDVTRLALAAGDTARARAALYGLVARNPEGDDAAAAVGVAIAGLPPHAADERVALARAMKAHGGARDALIEVARAVQQGDSSGATLVLFAELLAGAGRLRDAAGFYAEAARDSSVRPLALYRRARLLLRLGTSGATDALAGFAEKYPADSAAPSALALLGDTYLERGERPTASRWYAALIAQYPADVRASQARFRLAADAIGRRLPDSAAALFRAEVSAGAPQRLAARYWLGKLAADHQDTATARTLWVALARDDSLGYYGMRARRAASLAPLQVAAAALSTVPDSIAVRLGRLDTLVLAGLDSEARQEVQGVLATPPDDLDALLAWSQGLAARGWGPAGVRLGWQAAVRASNDPRVLRAIFPWPNRAAVEAEAREFKLDSLLFAAIVRQESTFDPEALSPAGARGLAQLLPGTAAHMARGLDVAYDPAWITVPDLNLHLGAAHLAELVRRFGGRVEAAVAAYNAGGPTVQRWLGRAGNDDPDAFVEAIPYAETRGYVRSVLRNRELYRALYASATN